MRKEAEKLTQDLRAIADRVREFSYYTDAARIREIANNIEDTFVKHRCAACGQNLADD